MSHFYQVEDTADRESGDLSPRSIPVHFLPSKPAKVRVRQSKRVLNRKEAKARREARKAGVPWRQAKRQFARLNSV